MKFLVDGNVLSEPTKAVPNPHVIAWLRRHEADIAVYQAKLRGRNCVVCASEVPRAIRLTTAPPDEWQTAAQAAPSAFTVSFSSESEVATVISKRDAYLLARRSTIESADWP